MQVMGRCPSEVHAPRGMGILPRGTRQPPFACRVKYRNTFWVANSGAFWALITARSWSPECCCTCAGRDGNRDLPAAGEHGIIYSTGTLLTAAKVTHLSILKAGFRTRRPLELQERILALNVRGGGGSKFLILARNMNDTSTDPADSYERHSYNDRRPPCWSSVIVLLSVRCACGIHSTAPCPPPAARGRSPLRGRSVPGFPDVAFPTPTWQQHTTVAIRSMLL